MNPSDDNTKAKQAEALLRARLYLSELAQRAGADELIQTALDKAEELTDSRIGFFHLVDEDQENLTLQAWSTNTLQFMCRAEGKGLHYPVSEAGVWVDCIRAREAVIHNDYAGLPHKKGLPPGHAPVIRELVVPIIHGDRVAAIIGVGNRATDYTANEVDVLQSLAVPLMDLLHFKWAEEALQREHERNISILESIGDGFFSLDRQWRVIYINEKGARMLGQTREGLLGKNLWEVFPEAVGSGFWQAYQRAMAERTPVSLEEFYPPLNAWFEARAYPAPEGLSVYYADITQRKRTEEALRAANDALAVADRQKDEFLAMLAHELRNPLAPIRNAVQILNLLSQDASADIERMIRHFQVIDRQVTHMARLLEDLLDVSRVTRGKITLERRPLPLKEVLDRAVETTTPLIEARRHRLEVTMPSGDLRVEGDIDRLAQVVGNLLANAVKYTDEGGRIWLEGRREENRAIVRVGDSGIGIDPEMLPRVFDLFAQVDQSAGRSRGGLGIGLSLVKKLVEMHGGEVAARSEGPGRGSVFEVRLPLLAGTA